MTTRKIKKIIGGSKIRDVDQTIDIVKINDSFCQLFLFFLKTQNLQYEKTKISVDKKYIYTGFIDPITHIIFGSSDITDKPTTLIQVTIDDTPLNRQLVNQFKLHMMSIMANYTLQGGTTLYERINPLLNPLKIPDIMKVLEIKEVPVVPQVVKVNDDMLELYIYREFGIKCILKGECYKSIETKFFQNNPNIQRNKLKESTFRDLYVNLFDYITGSEISVFSKEKGLLSCVEKIDVALKDLKIILTENVFNGARTNYNFNIKTLITCMNNIRVKVNASLEITGGYHISNDIFT